MYVKSEYSLAYSHKLTVMFGLFISFFILQSYLLISLSS